MRDTSSIGQVGEIAVMQRLIRNGWRVSIPYGNSAPYDLVAEKATRFVRLQVRTTRAQHGFLAVNCRTRNNRVRPQPGQFDFLVVYDFDGDAAYVVPESEAIRRALFHIRLTPTRNGQNRRINVASDFLERWDQLGLGA